MGGKDILTAEYITILLSENSSLKKYENGLVQNVADIDAELTFLQMYDTRTNFYYVIHLFFRRLDCLEQTMDDKMKLLSNVANNIALTQAHRQNNDSNGNE